MPTAAYCEHCRSNVYVTAEGRCPHGHGPERLSGHYEVAAGAAPPPGPIPRFQRPMVKTAQWALLIIVVVLLLVVGGGVYACSALLREEEPEVLIDEGPTTTTTLGGSSTTDPAAAPWYAVGDAEMDYVGSFESIETSAFEAMDRLEAVYPATTAAETAEGGEAMDVVASALAEAQALQAPAKYAAIHSFFLDGLDLYLRAGAIMSENDFAELQGATREEVADLLTRARDQFLQMLDAKDALEMVWGSE